MKALQEEIKELQEEIEKIKARNKKVEADKAWELSHTRTAFIAISTYLLLYIFFLLVKAEQPFLNAFISVVAYLLSTSSYTILKRWWLKRRGST